MSEAGRRDEQSLEDILSSIRKKISADPDMSAPTLSKSADEQSQSGLLGQGSLTSETASSETAGEDPASSPAGLGGSGGVLAGSTSAVSQSMKDEFSARLPRMFGNSGTQDSGAADPSGGEDDLSDMFEDPLPNVLSRKDVKPFDADLSSGGSPSGSDTQALKMSDGRTAETTDLAQPELGSFVPGQAQADDVPGPLEGGLAARLGASASPEALVQVDEPASNALLDPEPAGTDADIVSEPSTDGVTGSLPRSMESLSSGFILGSQSSLEAGSVEDQSALLDASDASLDDPVGEASIETTKASPLPSFSESESVSENGSSKTAESVVVGAGLGGALVGEEENSAIEAEAPATELAAPVAVESESARSQSTGGKTLEDTVSEMLRPMLREWIDANMPRIVENALRIEVLESTVGSGDVPDKS